MTQQPCNHTDYDRPELIDPVTRPKVHPMGGSHLRSILRSVVESGRRRGAVRSDGDSRLTTARLTREGRQPRL